MRSYSFYVGEVVEVMERKAFSEDCFLAREDGRVSNIGKNGHYGRTVRNERADKSFVGLDKGFCGTAIEPFPKHSQELASLGDTIECFVYVGNEEKVRWNLITRQVMAG